MKNTYKYINSNDLIQNLTFKYVETYSLQRGEKYYTEFTIAEKDLNTLEKRKSKKNDLNPESEQRLLKLKEIVNYTQYLIDKNGAFHSSSVKMNTFDNSDKETKQIISILKNPILNKMDWMCAPKYRDGIVFYGDNDKIVLSLNICLSCEYMQLDNETFVDADTKTYEEFRKFFIEIGHNVEKK
ncbi:hypothetical protein [Halpernia frigidisoli]|uniref:Uncharacterized protein n=1 Tax=Halpernia frigidisoli TaxID=1125876 RepID=A0A1I3F1F1_9FLAO|nr:hypothetical protein [Halpernia frigidisoli]SFI05027.1 hypothetical protein SAMN05443292_1089 [Halpernia frigidisoli]